MMNEHGKKPDSQIQRMNEWLPVGRGRESGQIGIGEYKVQTTVHKINELQGYIYNIVDSADSAA